MKGKNKVILGSALAIAMSASMIAGSTFALFTSESTVNIAVTSAKVNVSALVDENSIVKSYDERLSGANEKFTATYIAEDKTLSLTNMAAGDKVSFNILLTNESTIDVKYRTTLSVADGLIGEEKKPELFKELNVTFGGAEGIYDGSLLVSKWKKFVGDTVEENVTNVQTIPVTVELPYEKNVQGAGCTLTFGVEAVQGNAETLNPEWNGTSVEKDWYDETSEAFTLSTEEQFAGLAELVNAGTSFAGKTVTLGGDLNLGSKWAPMGSLDNQFDGTFDGAGHKVNIALQGVMGDYDDTISGIFNYAQGATFKNLILRGSVEADEAGVLLNIGTDVVIENVVNYADVNSTLGAGIVDVLQGNSTVIGCVNYGNFSGEGVNGLISMWAGESGESLNIENCHNYGSVMGMQAGGILAYAYGNMNSLTMKNCTNEGDISAAYEAGGFVGKLSQLGEARFINCINQGAVTSDALEISDEYSLKCAGGIIGMSGGVKALYLEECAGGTCEITAGEQGVSGRLVGRLSSAAERAYFNIDDDNGDNYSNINIVGGFGDGTYFGAYLVINSGTVCGDLIATLQTFIEFKNGAKWNETVYAADTVYKWSSNGWEIKN